MMVQCTNLQRQNNRKKIPVPSVVSTEGKQYQQQEQQEQQEQQQTTTNKPQLLWFVGSLARASP